MRRPGRETLHMMCVVPDEKKKERKYISVNSKTVESIETVSLVSWWVPLKRRREKLKCGGDVIANDYICVPYQQMWVSSSSFITPRDIMPSDTQKPLIEENFSGSATSHPW